MSARWDSVELLAALRAWAKSGLQLQEDGASSGVGESRGEPRPTSLGCPL